MAFTPVNRTTADQALAQMQADSTAHFFNMVRAVEQLVQAHGALDAMPSQWGGAITFINDKIAANPDDPDWQTLKARLDRLAEDFTAMRNEAEAVRDAAQAARTT